ncbi:Hypothetical predicted protein [Mytilus galloprovincialis]|uniref:Uncharacterized protein n=1 Tax=Mytilus galloprovincialis TaxID=29158 RepID=A0A8B6H9F8_MYTGA|nr:Hypothetical predicted protein [Mytilus galloprovincialis]
MNLLTATGAASEFSGKVDLEIKLGNHVCKHEFLLAEIKDAAIIGTDFMSRFHIDILFTKGSLRIGNDFIPYFTNQGEVSCCKVSIAETVEVPPHSEMIIKGHAFGRIKYNSIGIVETNKEFIEKTGLLLARRFVKDFAIVAKPLHKLTEKAHDAEAGVATEQLKNDQVKAQVNPGLEDVNTIHNEAFTNEKCVYGKTLVCPNPGTPMEAISNKECMGEKLDSNQINPSCQGPMTYQMLMPTGETLTDVCWSDSSTKGQMDFDVRAVQTRSMKKTTPEILPNGLISSKESDDFDKSLDLQKRARAR